MSLRGDGTAPEAVDVLAVIDADLTVAVWTLAASRLWGYAAEEVLHRPVARLLAEGGAAPAGVFTAGGREPGQVRIRRRDGRQEEVRLSVSALDSGWLLCVPGPAVRPGLDPPALEALLGHAPLSLALWDRDLRCTWFNEAVHNHEVFRRDPELGGYVTDLLDTRHPDFLVSAMRQVLDSGRPLLRRELWPAGTMAARGDRECWIAFVRLEGRDGRALGLCSVVMSVSRGRGRGRLQRLSEAELGIGTTLDPMDTAQELAETAVPDLADYVTIDLSEAIPLGQEPLEHLRSTGESIPGFYRAGVASVHSDLRESLWARGTPVFVPPSSPFTAVLESRQSHFEPVLDTSPGTWLDHDPDRARVVRQTGMHSLMVVPLLARGTILGVAVFVRSENPVAFSEPDLVLAEDLVARASLSLENAISYTRERTAALALQRGLLPHRLSGGGALEVASRYLPSDTHAGVGGDWFDVIPMPDGRVALVVGDVVGHGINAAATMGRLRTMVRTLTKLAMPPAELLTHIDELVLEMGQGGRDRAAPSPMPVGATCLYAVYDPATGRCTMASAGHPPPAVVAPDHSVHFAGVTPGAPIGVGLGAFEPFETELPGGCVLALYTDGLVETRDADIDHGLERLRGALARPFRSLDELCGSVVAAMAPEGPADDDTALLLARALTPEHPDDLDTPNNPHEPETPHTPDAPGMPPR